MAEIKIEQKKQNWPWMFAGLVIAAILVYFIVFRDKSNSNTIEEVTETSYVSQVSESGLLGVKENNSTVAAFVSFVKNETNRVSLNLAYIHEAISKLTAATNAMAGEIDYDIQADLEKVKESAVIFDNEPFDSSYAKNIKNTAEKSTTALQNMQLAKYPGLTAEVDELKSASASINPEEYTLGQKDEVKNYFAKASNLLEKMN
jgi:flagellar biosynthesis/type III secretory pathway M-ring protein FliF/YscJ